MENNIAGPVYFQFMENLMHNYSIIKKIGNIYFLAQSTNSVEILKNEHKEYYYCILSEGPVNKDFIYSLINNYNIKVTNIIDNIIFLKNKDSEDDKGISYLNFKDIDYFYYLDDDDGIKLNIPEKSELETDLIYNHIDLQIKFISNGILEKNVKLYFDLKEAINKVITEFKDEAISFYEFLKNPTENITVGPVHREDIIRFMNDGKYIIDFDQYDDEVLSIIKSKSMFDINNLEIPVNIKYFKIRSVINLDGDIMKKVYNWSEVEEYLSRGYKIDFYNNYMVKLKPHSDKNIILNESEKNNICLITIED